MKHSKKDKEMKDELPVEQASEDVKNDPSSLHALRGMRDVLPEETKWWKKVFTVVEEVAEQFRFERIIVPVVEPTSLFQRSVGTDTDVVEKEMYSFKDKSDEPISLRPEFTASFARAYMEHGMHNRPQPVRLWDMGPVFRYDRPQAGRLRQFWQFNFEILGDAHPVVDATLIQTAYTVYARLGIPVELAVNSIGDKACRNEYIVVLRQFVKTHVQEYCEDCQRRYESAPLRILDCKNERCKALLQDAPQMVDWLCAECRQHFVQVLEYLDELEVPYVPEPQLVRGLDYYGRTTFEVLREEGEGEENNEQRAAAWALGGGGRYDALMTTIGGRATPGVGFAGGIDRMVSLMQRGIGEGMLVRAPQIFIAQLGNESRKAALKLLNELRREGFTVAEQFSKDGLSSQLEIAGKLRCAYTLIVGQKELMDKTIILRDMESGIQEIIDMQKVVSELKKRVQSAPSNASFTESIMREAGEGAYQEVQKIDYRREEYLITQSVQSETEAASDVLADEAPSERRGREVDDEGDSFDEFEEGSSVEQVMGVRLKWVSEDYEDEDEKESQV